MKFRILDLAPIYEIKSDTPHKRCVVFGVSNIPLMALRTWRYTNGKLVEFSTKLGIWQQYFDVSYNAHGWIDIGNLTADADETSEEKLTHTTFYLEGLPDSWGEEDFDAFMTRPMVHAKRLMGAVLSSNEASRPTVSVGAADEFLRLVKAVVLLNGLTATWRIMYPGEPVIADILKSSAFQSAPVISRIFNHFQPSTRLAVRRGDIDPRAQASIVVSRYEAEKRDTLSAHTKIAYTKEIRTFYHKEVAAGLSTDVARQELASINLSL